MPTGPEHRLGISNQVVSLVFLGSNIQEPDGGLGHPQHVFGIDRPHDPVLIEIFRLGLHVGAHVNDNRGALVCGVNRGNSRPAYAWQKHLGVEQAGPNHGPGVARRDHRLDVTGCQQHPAPGNRIITLLPKRLDRLLMHLDRLTGMNDGQAIARSVGKLMKFTFNPGLITYKNHLDPGLSQDCLHGPFDYWTRCVVAPHGV